MKITEKQLKRIIAEEMQKMSSSSEDRVVKVTPEYLNSIIKEEYDNFNRKKRIQEARRRRLAEARRRRRRS